MVDKNSLTRWLLTQRSEFQIQCTEFDWPSRYSPGLFDFSTALSDGQFHVEGRGIDPDREIALEKSVCEAVERLICQRLNIASVGVAISGHSGATVHAEEECLERYYLTQHLNLKRPFIPVANEDLLLISRAVLQEFHRCNPEARAIFYRMATPREFIGSVCRIRASSGDIFLGFSLSKDGFRSLNRSFREAIVNFASMKDAPERFSIERRSDPNLWHLQSSFVDAIEPLFKIVEPRLEPSIPEPPLQTVPIDLTLYRDLKDCPFKPVRACIEIGGDA